jgi:hypothetical protein
MALMKTTTLLQGAIVLSDDDVRAIVSLLTSTMIDRARYIHYSWVNEINTENGFDFIIVANVEHISMLRKHYAGHSRPVPPIVHFVRRQQLEELNYAADFPGLTIYPIEYSVLDDSDSTLKYDSFFQAIQALEKAKQGEPS